MKTIKFICEFCEKHAQKNEEMSNKNWDVIDYKPCAYCGGKLKMVLE